MPMENREETRQIAEDAAARAVKKSRGQGKFVLLAFVLGLALGAYGMYRHEQASTHQTSVQSDENGVVLEELTFSHTAADFQDAVLEEASQHTELIVMEQPLSVETTVTKAGLGNWEIFSKYQDITYYGTGVYTVDLAGLTADDIVVDDTEQTVTITIPHAVLSYVTPDLERTEFSDTEHGLLAFGDIKLTAEEQNELEQAISAVMQEELSADEYLTAADEIALLRVQALFQPLVTTISPSYSVVLVQADV